MTLLVGQRLLVGLGEMHCTNEEDRLLVARPLGSTTALAIFDRNSGVGGMAHWMLPDSTLVPDRGERRPLLFADLAVALLIEEIRRHSGNGRADFRAALAGAASLPNCGDYDVGRRNRDLARKLLSRHRAVLEAEETGGTAVRELGLEVASGKFYIHELHT